MYWTIAYPDGTTGTLENTEEAGLAQLEGLAIRVEALRLGHTHTFELRSYENQGDENYSVVMERTV